MRSSTLLRLFIPASLALSPLWAATLQESWETGYQGPDAAGKHVLGYWKFDESNELKDSSGKNHELALAGALIHPEGRFGQALESASEASKPHSARVTVKEGLSPTGPFTLEMWIQPKPEFDQAGRCYLLDKRYTPTPHADYAWQLSEPDASGHRRLILTLGFGTVSETFHSEPVKIVSGQWQHLAITYDAAGTVTFYLDGSLISQTTKPGFGGIVPGSRFLHIGDRIGSNFSGFPGFIDEVRISTGALLFEGLSMELVSPRRVWQRQEKAAPAILTCTNLRRHVVSGARLTVTFGGDSRTFSLPDLQPGAQHQVRYPFNTALKAGEYSLHARLEMGASSTEKQIACQLVGRSAPQMPVILWGGGELAQMKDIGFTHYMTLGVPAISEIWENRQDPAILPAASPEVIANHTATLDEALANGMGIIARLSPNRYLETKPELFRVDRQGKPWSRHDIMALNPELPPFFEKVGRSLATTYGQHPALAGTLVNSEVRDASQPSFTPTDVQAYRDFAQADIPAEVITRRGVHWSTLKGFPADRVIPEDHPILKYYRWFWTVGDGWNALHTALSKGVKSSSRSDHFTFFDPAVRQPSISGSGGDVDILSHWTYTYPDPQRIGLCTDQLMALSEASGKSQRVMKMTQLIWYRSQTAPIKKTCPEDLVPWMDHDPDAAYITIAPIHLKEAFWTKISRPVQGIMYHGWQSLVPTDSTSSYRYTNPNTVHVLKELIHDVIRPLGPTLMALPDDAPAEVAFLESFTSQMLANRGGYGSNLGWAADVWLALQHAHVRTDILYEETLLKKGLEGRHILVMPDCDVLTTTVVQRIQSWQQQGGKIIADENLCPGLRADIVLPSFKRVKKAAEDKARVLQLASSLGSQVTALGHTPAVTADTPEVILRTRRYGDARYLFAINDRREAGTYVGQYGLVMENGLPTNATLTCSAGEGDAHAAIYDLTRSSRIYPQRDAAGSLRWPVDLGPGDGRIYMILPKPLGQLNADLPTSTPRGQTVQLKVRLSSTPEGQVNAVIPLDVQIRDANGKAAEGSGYYAAEGGLLTLPISIATNDDPGTWEVRIRELASRLETTRWMNITP